MNIPGVPFDVLQHLFGRVASVGRAEVDRYTNWGRGMMQQVQLGAQTTASGATCACRLVTPQGLALCRQPAVAQCCVCRQYCCLDHVFVNPRQAVCGVCVASARVVRGKQQPVAPQTHEPAFTRADALKELRLKEGVDIEIVRQQYRRLAKRHHPDGARDERDRERREARMKRINQAYHLLVREAESQKAA